MPQIDLKALAVRESEQIEWKENVADPDDVVETISAFANDLANLGGGYVVCGAREDKDEHGFPVLRALGLTAKRLKEVEGIVLTRCRERVSPPIAPLVEELSIPSTPGGPEGKAEGERRILVFIVPATNQAHMFRRGDNPGRYFVRISRSTCEARNGLLRELLVRKGALKPWDRRPCATATLADIDLLALRDALLRIGILSDDRGVEPYLSDVTALSPFVPPMFVKEPLTGILRPRNFTMLLFGRSVQQFIPGAWAAFSIYPGPDRSQPHAERHELAGTVVAQADRLFALLDAQSFVVFDKTDLKTPNARTYPQRALREAMINALAHRDYELPDPARVTVFSDRIEIASPGSLPTGVDPDAFRSGRAGPKWRNQTLAWFFNRLQLAQAEGQGIPTILSKMREEGNPPPVFEVNEGRVLCVLPARPRAEVKDRHAESSKGRLKILFINATPSEGARLAATDELRQIEAHLGGEPAIELVHEQYVRVADLTASLLRHRPQIVHLSGHGHRTDLPQFQDDAGEVKPFSLDVLGRLFGVLGAGVRGIVLDAVYSAPLAQTLGEHVDFVIGLNADIPQSAAVRFATAFYLALAHGESVMTAFDLGCIQTARLRYRDR